MKKHPKVTVFMNDGKSIIPQTGIFDLILKADGTALIVWKWNHGKGEPGDTPEFYHKISQNEIEKLPDGNYFLPKVIQSKPGDTFGNN